MTVTGIFTALIVGLIVGALGRLVIPGKQSIPVWLTMLIGVVAALLGTALARVLGVRTEGFSLVELLVQVALAAVGVFAIVGLMGRGDHTHHSRG
ncbi:transglycosylase [Pilimelia anulata]|uniref:Transglycosylase n=1 Tax=Pilimelia anulata TaxID=53371 RepID=A0A8J3B5Y3_9ACTN|nr:GlsB/YeaQ/YmgE family stress response membrane protein [Pilimelia anulata]GGJ74286.1 transglycosylase [Pilimelia anulata]